MRIVAVIAAAIASCGAASSVAAGELSCRDIETGLPAAIHAGGDRVVVPRLDAYMLPNGLYRRAIVRDVRDIDGFLACDVDGGVEAIRLVAEPDARTVPRFVALGAAILCVADPKLSAPVCLRTADTLFKQASVRFRDAERRGAATPIGSSDKGVTAAGFDVWFEAQAGLLLFRLDSR